MEDPVVGGYSAGAGRAAPRDRPGHRLAQDHRLRLQRPGRASRRGRRCRTRSAYDPTLKTECGDYDPARARALLDLYGFVDKDGDGWRERPDGSPLVLRDRTRESQARFRKIAEVLIKNMKAIGIRVEIDIAQWPENLKAARAGKLPDVVVGGLAAAPDARARSSATTASRSAARTWRASGCRSSTRSTTSCRALPDGPERLAAFREAERIALAYMPYKYILNRLSLDMTQQRVIGYRRPVFWQDWWQYVDIDDGGRRRGEEGLSR